MPCFKTGINEINVENMQYLANTKPLDLIHLWYFLAEKEVQLGLMSESLTLRERETLNGILFEMF